MRRRQGNVGGKRKAEKDTETEERDGERERERERERESECLCVRGKTEKHIEGLQGSGSGGYQRFGCHLAPVDKSGRFLRALEHGREMRKELTNIIEFSYSPHRKNKPWVAFFGDLGGLGQGSGRLWAALGRCWPTRGPQDGPQMAPSWPEVSPRWPKMGPRWAPDGPRWPKMGSRYLKMTLHGPKMGP